MAIVGFDDTGRDEHLEVPAISPQCTFCRHLTGPMTCKAFKEIPLSVWIGEVSHLRALEGDGGIMFAPIQPVP